MKRLIYSLIALFSILFSNCYLLYPPEVLLNKDFDGKDIAVLNFSKIGPNLPENVVILAADKLSDALFFTGKFSVIDRSKVNDAESAMQISTPEMLSADQIQKLGLKLKANYLILGQVQNISKGGLFDNDAPKEICISFRIISVATSDVLGMATYKFSYKKNIVEKLNDAMALIAKKMVK